MFLTTHHSQGVYPAGLPITARGLTRAHRQAVVAYLRSVNPRRGEEARTVAELSLGRFDLTSQAW